MGKKLLLAMLALPLVCIAIIVFAGLVGIASYLIIKYFVVGAIVLVAVWFVTECQKDKK